MIENDSPNLRDFVAFWFPSPIRLICPSAKAGKEIAVQILEGGSDFSVLMSVAAECRYR